MATAYVLYNKKAGDCNAQESVEPLEIIIPDKSKFAQKANEVYKLFKGTEIEKLANEIKSVK